MSTLAPRHQLMIGAVLVALMAATRGQHFATLNNLPGASWAVFFLAGVYLRPLWVFPMLIATVTLLDYSAVTWGGAGTFCITPAYAFLLPAYGALWLAGRWYAQYHHATMTRMIGRLTLSLLVGALLCELFSSGGFYFLSGRFAQTSLVEFGARLVKYFPHDLSSLAFYVGIAAVIHAALSAVNKHNVESTISR
ncbi:MAG: hypothetical protein M3A44_13905 [Gammaproteobacteria bacterium]